MNFMNNFNNKQIINRSGRGFPDMNNNNRFGFNNKNYMYNIPKKMEGLGMEYLMGTQQINLIILIIMTLKIV